MESKVHIRVDQIEIDCEGSEEFVRVELPKILDAIGKFSQIAESNNRRGDDREVTPKKATVHAATTATVATKLGAKTGADVVMAAAAKLSLIDNREDFSRDGLLAEMKNAKGFYKKTYSNNLSSYLSTLVKQNKLHEVSSDCYSIPESVAGEMRKLLG